ncbi:MAG TPA: lysylphosphatidylglycerol synthase transmembrane domain-containing protein [Crocinitomicaceae bacterium]|nr:lysylphosphatidylglycerol synthase transmembrane domain-containing protein [Crocinitomicaceae bacterium]
MKNNEDIIGKTFQSWKIVVAVLLGISVAIYMLYSSLSETYFIPDSENGTHAWRDFNGNGKVDASLAQEFHAVPNGTYKQQQLSDVLKEINWTTQSIFWIFLSVVFMVGRDLGFMWRIRALTNRDLSWKRSFYVIMIWEFASALAPGVAGGTAVAMFILNKEKIELGRSTAIVIVTAFLDNLFFVVMIPFVFLFIDTATLFPSEDIGTTSIKYLFWIAYGIKFALDLLLAISIFVYPQLVQKLLSFVFRLPFLKKWKAGADKTGENIVLTATILRKEKRTFWVEIIASTWVSWISRYLVINCVIMAFIHLDAFQHFVILCKQLTLWIIMMISPTPGGSGVAEFAFGKLMVGMGASSLLLAGLAIIWRLIAYFPYLFIGAILLPKWLRGK